MYYKNILDTVGNTPLIKINKLNPNPRVIMLAKLESKNPGGSIKDRTSLEMIRQAISSGKLKKGGTIVEATGAGNTGIGLAMAARVLGYSCVLVLPDKVSEEKRNLLKAFGARVVVAPTSVAPQDPRSYYRVAERLAKEISGAYQPDQYSNPANPKAHFDTTGPEIWEQTQGKVTHVVVTVGTGGTISGVGKYLKKKNPKIKIIGVDHTGSVFLEYFKTGKIPSVFKAYKTEGFGEDFIPKTVDFSVVDSVIQVEDKESFLASRQLVKDEGILAGSSSGATLVVARKIAKKIKEGMMVLIFADTGTNYLTKFYNDDWMKDFGFLEEEVDSIKPLLNKKIHLISVDSSESPKEAVRLMTKYNISQMPVLEKKKIVGIVSEGNLLKALYGQTRIPVSVSEIMDKDFIAISLDSSKTQLAKALSKKEMVVITDKNGKPVDVLTRIDFLGSIT